MDTVHEVGGSRYTFITYLELFLVWNCSSLMEQ